MKTIPATPPVVAIFTTVSRPTHSILKAMAAARGLDVRSVYRLALRHAATCKHFTLQLDTIIKQDGVVNK
jgi:hypothetical protein